VRIDPATLADIEEIKQLKARYCRLLDAKDWAAWRELFTDDFVGDTAAAGGRVVRGADAFVAFTRRNLASAGRVTAHQVHAPEIEVVSPDSATGVWALEDVVRLGPGVTLRGYGHYHETYRRVDGRWRIASLRLTRLREDVFNLAVSVYVSPRIRRALRRFARD